MKATWWLLCAVMLPYLSGQNLTMEVKTLKRDQRLTWEIEGMSDLPNRTLLSAELRFGNTPITGSGRRVRVRAGGGFDCKFAYPADAALSGEYTAVVRYDPVYQTHDHEVHARLLPVETKKKFYHAVISENDFTVVSSDPGDVFYHRAITEGRSRQREYLKFFKAMIADIEQYNKDLRDQAWTYLQWEPRQQYEEIMAFIEPGRKGGIYERYQEMRKNFDAMTPPQAICPYGSPDTIVDLREALKLSEEMWRVALKHLYDRHRLAVPENFSWLDSEINADFTRAFNYYSEKTKKHFDQILKREPFPENLGISDLHEDLLWFDTSIFQPLLQLYGQHREKFVAEQWDASLAGIEMELEQWHERILEYEQSPLATNPKIGKHLKILEENLRKLADIYGTALRNQEPPSDGPVMAEMRKASEFLTNATTMVPVDASEKQELVRELKGLLGEYFKLENDFLQMWETTRSMEGKKRTEKFTKWGKQYEASLQALYDHRDKCAMRPEIAQCFPKLLFQLDWAINELENLRIRYAREVQTGKNPITVDCQEFHQRVLQFKDGTDKMLADFLSGAPTPAEREKEREKAEKQKFAGEIKALFDKYFQLEAEFFQIWETTRQMNPGPERTQKFTTWHKQYEASLKDLYAQRDKCFAQPRVKKYFPKSQSQLNGLSEQLEDFVGQYAKETQTGENSITVDYLRFHQRIPQIKQRIDMLLGQ